MKYVKFLLAVALFAIYYVVICWIFGTDVGDPWERLLNWVKKGDDINEKK